MDEQEANRGLLGRGQYPVEQRQCGLIRPVQILEHEAQRLLLREEADELVHPVHGLSLNRVGREGADALLLRRFEREATGVRGGSEALYAQSRADDAASAL